MSGRPWWVERRAIASVALGGLLVLRSLGTAVLVFVLASIYLTGIVVGARTGLAFEVFIAFLFPALCMAMRFDRNYSDSRIRELFFIESVYNLMVVTSKIAIELDAAWLNSAAAWGFFGFMFLQLGGFLVQVTRARSPHGMIQTLAGVSVLFLWWWSIEDTAGVVDGEGRFLMWGEEVALSFRIVYSFWAINLILADSIFLPKLVQVAVQLASLMLAWTSGEFFHVRMLTASHLFFLDGLFGHYGLDVIDRHFATLPVGWESAYDTWARPTIRWVCTTAILGTLGWAVWAAIG